MWILILVFGFASVTPYDHAGQESPNIQKATESAIKPYLVIISLTFTQMYFWKRRSFSKSLLGKLHAMNPKPESAVQLNEGPSTINRVGTEVEFPVFFWNFGCLVTSPNLGLCI